MDTEARRIGSLTTKLIALALIVICLAVGAVGLILPVIPGLLFVAIAVMIIARHFPSIDRQLRKNRTIRGYLDSANGFSGLSRQKKVQFGCLLCVRLLIDTVACFVSLVVKLLGLALVTWRAYR